MRCVTLCLLIVAVAGCGGDDGKVPVYKTTGKLVWSGKPVLGLMVVFHPDDPSIRMPPVQPTGIVQEDGSFAVMCYSAADGLPPGDYTVTIREAPRADGSPPLTLPPAKYLDKAASPLKAKVDKKSVNELPPFEIVP